MNDVNAELKEWVSNQPYWIQLAATKLYTQEEVSDTLIDELLALLKTEDGQSKEEKIDLSGVFEGVAPETGDLRLVSIGDIEGIDALAPRHPLPFSPGLSVVYGNNGSGKSGYTRILKKLCGKPNAVDLQPNVFKAAPQNRQCTAVASVNGEEKTFVWPANGHPIEDLSPVDVFDSQTGFFYIDKEQEISYVPNEVALFKQLVSIFKRLQQKLKTEQAALSTKLPAKPPEFGDTPYLKAMFHRLRHDTDITKVEEYFHFSDDDARTLMQLEERLSAAPQDLASKKQNRKTQLENLIKQVTSAAGLVSMTAVSVFEQLEQDALQKRETAKQAAEAIEKETSFEGFGNPVWKAMWEAARRYSQQHAYVEAVYPAVEPGAKCVLCEQDLDDAAKHRLVTFESYVTGELESSATAAETAYQQALGRLPEKPEKPALVTALQAAQLNETEWLPVFQAVWEEIEKVVNSEKNRAREERLYYDLPPDTFKTLLSLVEGLNLEVDQHNKDAEAFDKVTLATQIRELKSKLWASGYIQAIRDEIAELQKKHAIEGWLKSVNTTAVSNQAGRVSKTIVTEAFVDRFNKELRLLGASRVSVELVKTRMDLGSVQHRIQLHGLNPQHSHSKAAQVLSEGEQRIVSLAAFLADVTSKPNSAPFIFDDPISSLDQTYEEHTAKRLVNLSAERQVIVFTHRLSLLGQLIEKGNADYRHIRREPWGCGEHGDLPLFAKKPINAVKNLKNAKLSAARKVLDRDGYDSYYPLAKAICSDFRILLERIIETDFLADVVARHRRSVTTQGKFHKLAKITPDDCAFIEGLMGEFSCFEHSQSEELPVEVPEPDQLDEVLTNVIAWHEEFSKRAS